MYLWSEARGSGIFLHTEASKMLLTHHSQLPTAYCLLLTAYCLLPTAYCLLLTAYCLLPTAYCLLPTATASALATTEGNVRASTRAISIIEPLTQYGVIP
jgi:hypothetical protein